MLRMLGPCVLVLALAACGGGGDAEAPEVTPPTEAPPPVAPAGTTPGETAATDPLELPLEPRGDSGVSGRVTLTPEESDTRIVIELDDAEVIPAGAYLQEGDCTAVKPDAAEVLALFLEGRSETVLEQELTNLVNGRFAVTVYVEETDDLQQPAGCADVERQAG